METACSPPSETTAPAMVDDEATKMVHKTKVIEFLGRTTSIVLQNDNGPCPLLSICNILLLRNYLNLSPDVHEVSQEKLLSLVAERLIDSNSNTNDKDAEYVENQEQNIADAIDLLPRLTTGIDVNIKYRRIDDFEFTRECAIFDLLDIPLYHGWIVDPQDHETASAIGSKSYNSLMEELVALEAQSIQNELPKTPEEEVVDFVAATTSTLGVPYPCISRGGSFNDSPVTIPNVSYPVSLVESDIMRKGDIEEEVELVRALKLSETILVSPSMDDLSMDKAHVSLISEESTSLENSDLDDPVEAAKRNLASYTGDDSRAVSCETGNDGSTELLLEKSVCSSEKLDLHDPQRQSTSAEAIIIAEEPDLCFQAKHDSTVEPKQNLIVTSESYEHIPKCDIVRSQSTNFSEAENMGTKPDDIDMLDFCLTPSNSKAPNYLDKPQAPPSYIDSSEPIYEGEDCILESKSESCQNQEPVYEGEAILAEQVGNTTVSSEVKLRSEMTVKEGDVVRTFLRSSASQLTVYGLFCLQDVIKERELCVFFRNNHFNTMFKFEGELYILVTDQGYINQPDLVWEKLNEVNGDTLYMNGNFKEFKVDDHGSSAWDEQNAMSSTADYLASIDNSAQQQSNFNSDMQLAIALQQQEFEQQQAQRSNDIQQQQQQQQQQQPPRSGNSRLVTGPQVPRDSRMQTSASSYSKQEMKSSKEKCTVM